MLQDCNRSVAAPRREATIPRGSRAILRRSEVASRCDKRGASGLSPRISFRGQPTLAELPGRLSQPGGGLEPRNTGY